MPYEMYKKNDDGTVTPVGLVANYVKDIGDGRTLSFRYSSGGSTSASWYACWNGNTLTYISKNDLKNDLGVNSKVDASYVDTAIANAITNVLNKAV